jgi:hypothetical protein
MNYNPGSAIKKGIEFWMELEATASILYHVLSRSKNSKKIKCPCLRGNALFGSS